MLISAVEKFVTDNDLQARPITVALSGGADSVAMLLLLNDLKQQLNLNLSAIHVNHGLSDNASQWMRFCRQLCERLHIPIHCVELTLEKRNRGSLEQIAREARYKAIGELMSRNGVLFTGHHSQDQFETFLLRLMRGAGLAGLGSMKPVASYPLADKRFSNLSLARPLLTFSKKELVGYLSQHQQQWVEDESNQSDAFDRNFIRNNLLPLFESRWPGAAASVEHTTSALQADSELLNEYLDDDLDFCVEEGFAGFRVINLDSLESMSANKRSALLRRFCYQQTGQALSRNALSQIELQMFSHNEDAQPKVQLDEYWALRCQHRMYVVSEALLANPPSEVQTVVPDKALPLNGIYSEQSLHLHVNDEAFEFEKFEVHFGRLTDKIKLHENGGSKQVKQLLKESGCPPWWRNHVPLLYNEGELVAVGSSFVALSYKEDVTLKLL